MEERRRGARGKVGVRGRREGGRGGSRERRWEREREREREVEEEERVSLHHTLIETVLDGILHMATLGNSRAKTCFPTVS